MLALTITGSGVYLLAKSRTLQLAGTLLTLRALQALWHFGA